MGENCADDLMETLRSGATVDEHMLDQILPYMALAGAGSIVRAEELSEHAKTNMWVIEQFLGKKFDVGERDGFAEVRTP